MSEKEDILAYYDRLAPEYDSDRFENSYGQYLDKQERGLLKSWLKNYAKREILDLGCGTGRLLNFAKNGVDFSKNMLEQAKEKYPNHNLIQSDISALPFEDGNFNVVYSMHVFMHLDMKTIEKTLAEVHRILKDGGIFIFDFPNERRRKAIKYKKNGWHGNTAMDLKTIESLGGNKWTFQKSSGFLLFPIHRLPNWIRPFFRIWDALLCRTFLKHFASYYCICIKKKVL